MLSVCGSWEPPKVEISFNRTLHTAKAVVIQEVKTVENGNKTNSTHENSFWQILNGLINKTISNKIHF